MNNPVILDIDMNPLDDSFEHVGLDGISKVDVKDKISVKIGDPKKPIYVHLGTTMPELLEMQTSIARQKKEEKKNANNSKSIDDSNGNKSKCNNNHNVDQTSQNKTSIDPRKKAKLDELNKLEADLAADSALSFQEKLEPYKEIVRKDPGKYRVIPGDTMIIQREAKKLRSNWLRRTNARIKKLKEALHE